MKTLFSYVRLGAVVMLLAVLAGQAEAGDPALSDADCIKCHDEVVTTLQAQESAHRDVIGCLDCHKGHPPAGKVIIPECSMCHDTGDQHHFTLSSCKRCHNPHAPVISDFTKLKNVKPGCLTCHAQPGLDMKEFPSAHSEQDCNNCHNGHGFRNIS